MHSDLGGGSPRPESTGPSARVVARVVVRVVVRVVARAEDKVRLLLATSHRVDGIEVDTLRGEAGREIG